MAQGRTFIGGGIADRSRGSREAVAATETRRLAAILVADIAGYSSLMGADEEGTLARLKACRRDLIDPGIDRHRGRIVKTTGDGLLIEFSSPVEAVRWAVETQQGMIERNADVPEDRRILFRIGINLGDVIVDDRDLFGDAVNIAARLESLAEAGGICISRTMREQIRDRLALPFEDGGEQSVKNIARPIRVYSLSSEAVAALPKAHIPEPPRSAARPAARHYVAAAALAVILVVAGGVWWQWPLSQAPPIVTASTSAPAIPTTAPRLSIVVLPFANLSDDRDQQYLADGLTEDLTTDLSRIAGTLVISRNSAFTYKGKSVDPRQVGRDLGVRYVVEGSIRRSANQVRVNAQMIDAESNAHLWAERFDRDAADLFEVGNEITGRIARSLDVTMIRAEAKRPTENPDALDHLFRGRAALTQSISRGRVAEAISSFERALDLDPRSVEAKGLLAASLVTRVLDQMTDSEDADIARAEELISQVLAFSPSDPRGHFAKGQLLRQQRRCEEAIPEFEAVLASNRNSVSAISNIGRCKALMGLEDEAIALHEQAIRLDPIGPWVFLEYMRIGSTRLRQSRTQEAITWLEKARAANPQHAWVRAHLTAAYGLNGQTDRAVAELAEARRLGGEGFLTSIAQVRGNATTMEGSAARARAEATFYLGLRKAGVPEE